MVLNNALNDEANLPTKMLNKFHLSTMVSDINIIEAASASQIKNRQLQNYMLNAKLKTKYSVSTN